MTHGKPIPRVWIARAFRARQRAFHLNERQGGSAVPFQPVTVRGPPTGASAGNARFQFTTLSSARELRSKYMNAKVMPGRKSSYRVAAGTQF